MDCQHLRLRTRHRPAFHALTGAQTFLSGLHCRAFPDAFTLRCFAFAPSDEQIAEDRKKQPNFIMFPPGRRHRLQPLPSLGPVLGHISAAMSGGGMHSR